MGTRQLDSCLHVQRMFDLRIMLRKTNGEKRHYGHVESDIDTAPLINIGMVCYELNQFEEAYKYFNDAYNYSKERAFQDRPKKYLEFYLRKRDKFVTL